MNADYRFKSTKIQIKSKTPYFQNDYFYFTIHAFSNIEIKMIAKFHNKKKISKNRFVSPN
jgi:hypothetical protein